MLTLLQNNWETSQGFGLIKVYIPVPKAFQPFKNKLNRGRICKEGAHKMAKTSQFTKNPMFSFVIWSSHKSLCIFRQVSWIWRWPLHCFCCWTLNGHGAHTAIQLFSALDYGHHINWWLTCLNNFHCHHWSRMFLKINTISLKGLPIQLFSASCPSSPCHLHWWCKVPQQKDNWRYFVLNFTSN